MRAQALVVSDYQLFPRFVVSNRGWKITGRNVTDNRIRIASLKVDDSDGVGLAQRDISPSVIGDGYAVGSGAEETASDGSAEINRADDRIGLQVDDRKAVAVRIGNVKISAGDGEAGGVQPHFDSLDFLVRRKINDGYSPGYGKCVFPVSDDRSAVR